MIKIDIPQAKKGEKSIEDLHWDWFCKKYNGIRNKRKRDSILKYILKITEKDLEILIKKPLDDPEFIRLNQTITKRLEDHKGKPVYNRWLNAIGKIFKYDDFITDKSGWNSYAYFKALGINVCPYCNRMYVFTVNEIENKQKKNGQSVPIISEKITAPEIDHFLPQDKYPHLTCSFYNMIPSCKVCNHVKSNKENGIVYPYKEGFEKDGTFRVYYNELPDNFYSLNQVGVKIRKTTPFSSNAVQKQEEEDKCSRIDNSVKTFYLTKIYEEHTIELDDLFRRYRNYCHPKIKDILRLFHEDELNNLEETSNKLDENQIKAILSLYAKKMKNLFLGLPLGVQNKQYPLRKFKEDIIEQLDETVKKMRNEK